MVTPAALVTQAAPALLKDPLVPLVLWVILVVTVMQAAWVTLAVLVILEVRAPDLQAAEASQAAVVQELLDLQAVLV